MLLDADCHSQSVDWRRNNVANQYFLTNQRMAWREKVFWGFRV